MVGAASVRGLRLQLFQVFLAGGIGQDKEALGDILSLLSVQRPRFVTGQLALSRRKLIKLDHNKVLFAVGAL